MDDERRRLADETLGRALEQAVRVDPSPAFLARTRLRIAREPRPSVWPTWSPHGSLVLVATILLGVTVTWLMMRGAPVLPSAPAAASAVTAPHTLPSVDVTRRPPAPQVRSQRTGPSRQTATDVQTVIAPGEAVALRLFATSLYDGLIDASTWQNASNAEPMAPIDSIDIRPIDIELLPVPEPVS